MPLKQEKSCLVVGAGMAGLTAARALTAQGWQVVVLDKGSGVGGRLATRRAGTSRFDYGAQFFTARDRRFAEAARAWEEAGWIAPWFSQDGHVRYFATSGMSALAKELAAGLDVRQGTRAVSVEVAGRKWRVGADCGVVLEANHLILTAPAPQSVELLRSAGCIPANIMAAMEEVEYAPCFALLARLRGPSRVPAPGYVRPAEGPVQWIADNTQKGISEGDAALTIHATAEFATEHFEEDPDLVTRLLTSAAERYFGSPVTDLQLHRWKYSKPVRADGPITLFSGVPAPFAIAGDGFGGSRVEGAFLSGLAAAESLAR